MNENTGPALVGFAPPSLTDLLAGVAAATGGKRLLAFVASAPTRQARLAATVALSQCETAQVESLLRENPSPLPHRDRFADNRRPAYIFDPGAEGGLCSRLAGAIEWGCHLAVPLTGASGELVGVLLVEAPEPDTRAAVAVPPLARLAVHLIEQAPPAAGRRDAAQHSQALLGLFQQMHSSDALPRALRVVVRHAVEAFGLSCAAIFDTSRGSDSIIQVASHGISPDTAERFVRFRVRSGDIPRREEFCAGNSVILSRGGKLTRDEKLWLDGLKLDTAALVPLTTRERGHDILAVGMTGDVGFGGAQLGALEPVVQQATTAIVWAHFLRNAESAVSFRAAVSALAVDLNAQSDRASALKLLCSRGRMIFRAAWGAVLMRSGEHLEEVAAEGDITDAPETLLVPLDTATHPAARSVLRNEVVFEEWEVSGTPRSVLAVPLPGGEGPIGVLLYRDLRDAHSVGSGIAGDARILGALAAPVLRNLDLLARLHAANAELRRANTLKDQMLASASHDLRTPLNVIIGYGQLAVEGAFGEPPQELKNTIERMVTSACEQLTLVEDLLNLSRIELNILSTKSTAVPLAPLFSEIEFTARSLVQDRPIRPVVHPVPANLCVKADPDRIRQILTNLVTNAAKFTDEGTIEVRATTETDGVTISVRDTGIGIAPEDQRTIFEPFSQLDTARAQSGAGLGLAIAQRLAHAMNGRLTVESQAGAGSTFALTLRAAESEAAAAQGQGNRNPNTSPAAAAN